MKASKHKNKSITKAVYNKVKDCRNGMKWWIERVMRKIRSSYMKCERKQKRDKADGVLKNS